MEIHPKIAADLRHTCDRLVKEGRIRSKEKLDQCYRTFRERFGPQKLLSLDGQALLEYMHLHPNRDSLVYWLEFKNDEDFPDVFGSIAGGSAFKFGVFRRNETGEWTTGPSQAAKAISVDDAVEIARKHRTQLVKGVELIEALPENSQLKDYRGLQQQLDQEAPDVGKLAWGHKYFHLMCPTAIDDYHSTIWQRYMLIKTLQTIPDTDERYLL